MATATYDKIATQTLGSAASSITFSSIAASWTDLRLVFVATQASGNGSVTIQFNGDTATNYSTTSLNGTGSSVTSNTQTSATYCYLSLAASGVSAIPHFYTADIFSYAGSTYKTVLSSGSEDDNGTGIVVRAVHLWRSTAAITSFTILGGNYATGTTATLYGIKAA